MHGKPYGASYNIFSNRLFLWVEREPKLSPEDYKAVKDARIGTYWPRGCFTGLWSPEAEDLIVNHFGLEIKEEDTPDDLSGRVERFSRYASNDERDAAYARNRIQSGAANTRRRLEGAERVMTRKSEEAAYWHDRIARSIRHAERRENPALIRRQIEGLEKDHRKWGRNLQEALKYMNLWAVDDLSPERAYHLANYGCHYQIDRDDLQGELYLSFAIEKDKIDVAEAKRLALASIEHQAERCIRWMDHIQMQIDFKRAYLGDEAVEPEQEQVPDQFEFAKGLWVQGKNDNRVYRIVRVAKDTISVDLKDRPGFPLRIAKASVAKVMPYDEVLKLGHFVEIASALEDFKSKLVFEVGKYAVVKGMYSTDVRYYKIEKVGRTKLKVQTDSVYRISGEIRIVDVIEVIDVEEKDKRIREAREETDRRRRMANREGEYSD